MKRKVEKLIKIKVVICISATTKMKKIVVRVNINGHKCERDVLNSVTKLEGISALGVDGEKGTLTVIGNVDPVVVVKQLRKIRKAADIISIGPAKLGYKTPEICYCVNPLPSCCKQCELVGVRFTPYNEPGSCSIL